MSPPPKAARPTASAALGPSPARGHTPSSPSSLLSHQDAQVRLLQALHAPACCNRSPAVSSRGDMQRKAARTSWHTKAWLVKYHRHALLQVNPPSTTGLATRYSEASTSTQDPPMSGWGAPKQAPPASQPSSLAPGILSQSMGTNLLSSLQVPVLNSSIFCDCCIRP